MLGDYQGGGGSDDRKGLDAELDAHTGDGGVHADGLAVAAERDTENRDTRENRDSLRAHIGKGGRTFRLRSGDGSINISR